MLLFFAFFCLLRGINGYGSGAPVRVCSDMTPRHHTDPQSSAAPYIVAVQSQSINPGGSTRITLKGKENEIFKGFFVQVRKIDNNEIIGIFDSGNGNIWQTVDCFDKSKSGITHVNKNEKSEFTVLWTAPVDYRGKASAWATFVENGQTFWVNVTSNVFEISGEAVKTGIIEQNPFNSVYDGCFESKGCFGGPDGCISTRNCKHVVTYTSKENSIDFEMIGETKGWIAVGFSNDNLMGEDAVTVCTVNGSNNRVDVFQAFNTPNNYKNQPLDDMKLGLSNLKTEYEDGFIRCRFTHNSQHLIQDQFQYDLNNKTYYLFLGRGLMESVLHPVRLRQHLANPYITASPIDVKDHSEIGLASDLFIKLHGSLMIAAWIGTVGIAIFIARYFKNVWPTEKHCGQKIWFTWHRALNILTLSLTIAAFVLIFIQIKGWSQVWEHNPHPILGLVVTFLVIVQPIMAIFRCHPGTPKRPIFNWLHFFVGNSAHILAVITLFFAKSLKKANLPDFYMWILIAFVAFHVIVFLVMELFACNHTNKIRDNQVVLKDLSNGNSFAMVTAEQTKNVGSRFRKVLLFLYVFGNVLFVVALIVTVFMSPVKER